MMGNCSFEPSRRPSRSRPYRRTGRGTGSLYGPSGTGVGRGRDVGTWSTDRGCTVGTEFVNSDWPHPAHLIWPHAQESAYFD
jgi:hypothetical protein